MAEPDMRGLLLAVRFFAIVPPASRMMMHAFVLVTLSGLAALVIEPGRGPLATLPILLLQAFAVSTGFVAHARRGYYDCLLTSGVGRATAALVHWIMSAIPGVLSWMVVVAGEAILTGAWSASTAERGAALVLVSTLPWAGTIALPRFTGAITWAVVSATALGLGGAAGAESSQALAGSAPGWQIAATLLNPMPLVTGGAGGDEDVTIVVVGVALCSISAAIAWAHRVGLPLESGQ